MAKNKIISAEEATKGMLKICQEQIKAMKRDGFTNKEIQEILNASLGGLMYGN